MRAGDRSETACTQKVLADVRYITCMNKLAAATALAIVLAACRSAPKQRDLAEKKAGCLIADVSSNDEVLTIVNTGDRTWEELHASLTERGSGDNSFEYTDLNKIVQPGATIAIPLLQFVRNDGLRYDPTKYAHQGISIYTAN